MLKGIFRICSWCSTGVLLIIHLSQNSFSVYKSAVSDVFSSAPKPIVTFGHLFKTIFRQTNSRGVLNVIINVITRKLTLCVKFIKKKKKNTNTNFGTLFCKYVEILIFPLLSLLIRLETNK